MEGQWSSWSDLSPCLSKNVKTKQRFCYSDNPNACVDDKPADVRTSKGVQTYTTSCNAPGEWELPLCSKSYF